MRPLPLLLHVLLCFALVANGVGAAMASARGTCGHADNARADASAMTHASNMAHAPAATQAVVEAHCAEMMAMAHDTDATMHHDLSADDANSDGDAGDAGCDDACSCACASHGSTALMPPALALPTGMRIADARISAESHATPSLPHPIRPPIA